ncbi:MAG TPA: hypothetical protein PK431_17085, partial [Chitinophagales bacterium]|nr:hypothetical protein [Chitinophagales bacterium]
MKKLLMLTFLFTSFFCEAQQYLTYIEWQKTIGGIGDDYLYSIEKTADGGYILGGSSNSSISGEKTDNNRGGQDYWVIKLDVNGTIEWQKTIGGSRDDILSSVQQTTDGGYILGGDSRSNLSGEKTDNCRGDYDYWVVKLNAEGNIVWQKTIGGSTTDKLNRLQQTIDGGYILGGWSDSNISEEKTENSRGGQDYWVIKLSVNGSIEWQKTIGGNYQDYLYSIQQTTDGGYILGGGSESDISSEKTEDKRGCCFDYWILKLSTNGTIEWQKTIGGYNDAEYVKSIQQTTDGGYILGGSSGSNISGEKTDSCRGYKDYWVIKLTANGTMEWQKTIGGKEYDNFYSIKQTTDNGYILGGSSSSNVATEKTDSCRGYNDYWIIKLSSNGTVEWQKTIGGTGYDDLYSIQQITNNEYILAGYSNSNIASEKTEDGRGSFDYWIVKLKVIDKPSSIIGKIFQSVNTNCTQETNEKGIQNVLVQTQKNGFFGISDSTGKYSILTDTGIYNVKPIYSNLQKPFLQGTACPSIGYHTVSFSQYGQDTSEINFANYEKQCAYLQVELAQARMRRCFNNNTTIKYC